MLRNGPDSTSSKLNLMADAATGNLDCPPAPMSYRRRSATERSVKVECKTRSASLAPSSQNDMNRPSDAHYEAMRRHICDELIARDVSYSLSMEDKQAIQWTACEHLFWP